MGQGTSQHLQIGNDLPHLGLAQFAEVLALHSDSITIIDVALTSNVLGGGEIWRRVSGHSFS